MRKKRISKLMTAVSILLCLSCIFSCVTAYASGYTQPEAKNDNVKVRFPFIIAPFQSSPGFFKEVKAWILIGTEMKVKGYSDDYTYVELSETGEKGYIYRVFINDDRNGQLSLNKDFDHVYVGKNNSNRIKVTYTGSKTIKWSSEPEGYVSINQETGLITGVKPGTVKVTVKAGNKSDDCTVTCINEWYEKETSTTTKKVYIKKNPGDEYEDRGSVSSGTSIKALGDLADRSGWIYVGANDIYGFVKLSDFPGIDYLMTECHYYDQGYNLRFGSASAKIYTYASVMNDVMMDLFKLKINPYVYPYTSPADQCKIWRYGSVKSNNLASSCPKSGNHYIESCLTTTALRNAMYNNGDGSGNDFVAKAVWTGHIMDGHKRSNSQRNPTFTIVFTTGNTVNSGTYTNRSSAEIRKYSVYELLHETAHQLGTKDHYCYGKDPNTKVCENLYCDDCVDKKTAPFCVMNKPFNVELYNVDDLFCDECKQTIESHLADHH